MDNLTQFVKKIRLRPDGSGFTVAAGVTSPLNSDPVDSAGADSVRFTIAFGAIVTGAATSIKAQQGAVSNMSDAADLEGSAQTVADSDDNKIFSVEIVRPRERYLRLVTLRATQNSTIDYLEAELTYMRKQPVTQDASVGGTPEVFNSPPEGTA